MMVGERLFTITAKGAITAGVRVLPLVPDDLLVGIARRNIAKVPWPEGQAFMERLLVLGKRAIAGACPRVRSKDALDRYAARYAQLADEEWYRDHEFEPARKASGQ